MAVFVETDTTNGRIRGLNVAGIKTFRGIPYGGSTAGKNRFKPPTPVASWAGTRLALNYGEIAPQNVADPTRPFNTLLDWDYQPGSGMGEDCLNLNVWTPNVGDNGKRPVLVYFHGGGFTRGSANHPLFAGDRLARFGDVVVVTVNHRLGVFGYLNLRDLSGDDEFRDSENAGTLDLVQSLEWVRDNIANFGGDPNAVTIFGQSGGGAKIATLMAMPRAKGLFDRAFAQSCGNFRQMSREESVKTAGRLVSALAREPKATAKLQEVPFEQVIEAQDAIGNTVGGSEFKPVIDGRTLPYHPLDAAALQVSAGIPAVLGYCLNDQAWMHTNFDLDDEGLRSFVGGIAPRDQVDRVVDLYARAYPSYSPYLLQATMVTDRDLLQRTSQFAERKASLKEAPVWTYRFDWPSPAIDGKFGAVHGMEMALVFHNTHQPTVGAGPAVEVLADKMASALVSLARTGAPASPLLPAWSPYTPARRETMVVNVPVQRVVNDPNHAFRLLWQELGTAG
jgi:para-nitrobenzyl esterase